MPAAADPSVVVIADFFFKPEHVDEALRLLAEVLPYTRGFDGCQTLETIVNLDDPGHVVLVERWTSRDAHLAYFAWRQESGSADGLLDLFSAPPSFQYFEPRPDI
jgi:quinol monooxygenase YgiN